MKLKFSFVQPSLLGQFHLLPSIQGHLCPGTLQCSKCHTLEGHCFNQLCEIIDTWAPVSQRVSVSSPLSKHFTVHLRPTRRASYTCSSGDKWLTKTTVFSLSSVYFRSTKGSDLMNWIRASSFLLSKPVKLDVSTSTNDPLTLDEEPLSKCVVISSITLTPTTGTSKKSLASKNDAVTVWPESSLMKLKVSFIQPSQGISVPFAAFNPSPSMPRNFAMFQMLHSGRHCFNQLCEIIDTWAPVSQRASVSNPLSKHFTVHLRPTRRTVMYASSFVRHHG